MTRGEDGGDDGGEPAPDDVRVDPLARLASELRSTTIAADVRAEAEEGERDARTAGLRRRCLADVLRDLRARGDVVAIDVAGRTRQGRVTHVAGDLVTLATPRGRLDACVDRIELLRVNPGHTGQGADVTAGPASFRARLFELELDGDVCTIGVTGRASELVGVLGAVAVDHLLVVGGDGQEWFLPTGRAAYVETRS